MSYYDYQPPNKFGFKDTLPEGDAEKIIKGSEFDDEFNKISAESQAIDQAQQEFDGRLDEEIENRIEGDQNLQNQIDNIVGGNIEIDPDQIPGLPELIDDALSGKADKDHTHDEYLTDAPNDTKQYVRQSKAWAEVTIPDGAPPSWGEITDKPAEFPPEAHSQDWSTITNTPTEYPPEDHPHDQYALGTELEAEIQARIAGDKSLEEDIEDLEAAIGTVIGQLAFGGSYDASTGLVARANISALTDGQPLPDYSQVTGTFVIVVVAGNNPEELDEADWLVAGEAGWVAIKYGTAGSVAWENVVGAPDFLTDAQGSIDGDSKEYVRKNGEWVEGSVGGSSLWEQNGDDIYYNDGNVGINRPNPSALLHMQSESGSDSGLIIQTKSTSDDSVIKFGDNGAQDSGRIVYQHSDDSMAFGTARNNHLFINNGGNVGIGGEPGTRTIDEAKALAKTKLTEWKAEVKKRTAEQPEASTQEITLEVTDGDFGVMPTEQALAEFLQERAVGGGNAKLQVAGDGFFSGNIATDSGRIVRPSLNAGIAFSQNGIYPADGSGDLLTGASTMDIGGSSDQFKNGYFSGDVTAQKFVGDGSGLTNLPSSGAGGGYTAGNGISIDNGANSISMSGSYSGDLTVSGTVTAGKTVITTDGRIYCSDNGIGIAFSSDQYLKPVDSAGSYNPNASLGSQAEPWEILYAQNVFCENAAYFLDDLNVKETLNVDGDASVSGTVDAEYFGNSANGYIRVGSTSGNVHISPHDTNKNRTDNEMDLGAIRIANDYTDNKRFRNGFFGGGLVANTAVFGALETGAGLPLLGNGGYNLSTGGLTVYSKGDNATGTGLAVASNQVGGPTGAEKKSFLRFARYGNSVDGLMTIGNNYNRDDGNFAADDTSCGVGALTFHHSGEIRMGTGAPGSTNPTNRFFLDTSGNLTVTGTVNGVRSLVGAKDLIEILSTLRNATKDENTLEGLRDSIGNAVGGLIEKFEAMQSVATQEIEA